MDRRVHLMKILLPDLNLEFFGQSLQPMERLARADGSQCLSCALQMR